MTLRILRPAVAGVVVFQLACAARDRAPDPDGITAAVRPTANRSVAQTGSSSLRDSVRELLVRSCGSCHRSGLSTAKPGALRIFDLDEPVWDRKMSNEQVQELARRLRSSEGMDPADRAVLSDYLKNRLLAAPS